MNGSPFRIKRKWLANAFIVTASSVLPFDQDCLFVEISSSPRLSDKPLQPTCPFQTAHPERYDLEPPTGIGSALYQGTPGSKGELDTRD